MARDKWDRYYTPDVVADSCLRHADVMREAVPMGGQDRLVVLDLGVGGGSWARAIKAVRPDALVLGVDIDPAAIGRTDCDDYLQLDVRSSRAQLRRWLCGRWPALVVSNPPFQAATTFLDVALDISPAVAFLMRATMAESVARFNFWCGAPLRRETTLVERIPFIAGGDQSISGTDNAPCCLFEFDERYAGLPLKDMLSWKVHRRSAYGGTVLPPL